VTRQAGTDPQFTDLQRRFLDNARRIAPLALARHEPLYRFLRYASPADKATVRAALVDRHFRFGRPRDFNDPFDCRPHFRLARPFQWLGRQRYRAASMKLVREKDPNDPAKEQRARDDLAKHSPEELIEVSEQTVRSRLLNSQLMLCLAGNRSALQMWAYYADRQHGVAIHLSQKVWPVATALRVSYGNRYPSITVPPDYRKIVREFVLRKANAWRHEDEYRVLVQDEDEQRFGLEWADPDTAVFPPGAVGGVTVGCLMYPADEQQIIVDAQSASPALPVYRAVAQRRRFELKFERIA
jgi:hypothetical protein